MGPESVSVQGTTVLPPPPPLPPWPAAPPVPPVAVPVVVPVVVPVAVLVAVPVPVAVACDSVSSPEHAQSPASATAPTSPHRFMKPIDHRTLGPASSSTEGGFDRLPVVTTSRPHRAGVRSEPMSDDDSKRSQFQWDEGDEELELRGKERRRYSAWKIFLPGFVVMSAAVALGVFVSAARVPAEVVLALASAWQVFLCLANASRSTEVEYMWPLEQHLRFGDQTGGTYREKSRRATVDLDVIISKGLVSLNTPLLKVLGNGECSLKLTVRAQKFSKSAVAKIEAAGGTVVMLDAKGREL